MMTAKIYDFNKAKLNKDIPQILEGAGIMPTRENLEIYTSFIEEMVNAVTAPKAPIVTITEPVSRGRDIEGTHYRETKHLDIKDIAKKMREDIKKAKKDGLLPKSLKVSVRISRYSMGQSLDITVRDGMGGPLFTDEYLIATKRGTTYPSDYRGEVYTKEAGEILDTLNEIHNAYNYDNSDVMSDYFDRNYYGSVNVDYDYREKEFNR